VRRGACRVCVRLLWRGQWKRRRPPSEHRGADADLVGDTWRRTGHGFTHRRANRIAPRDGCTDRPADSLAERIAGRPRDDSPAVGHRLPLGNAEPGAHDSSANCAAADSDAPAGDAHPDRRTAHSHARAIGTGPYVNTDSDSDSNTGADSGTNSGADPDTNSGADSDSNTGADPDTNSGAHPDTNSGAYPDANSGAHADTDTNAKADGYADSQTHAHTHTDDNRCWLLSRGGD
jgi:hypothetical protein